MEGWKTQSLGDVCHVYQPETIAQRALRLGPYPVYGANGQIGWHDSCNHDEPELLLGCRGSVGFVHKTTGPAWINGNAMVVRPRPGVIERDFLAYALAGGVDLSAAITGAAQPQITRTSLSPISLSYPADVNEQRRIVAILDEAFEAIATAKANTEKNLQNAGELFTNRLERSFTEGISRWRRVTLESIGATQTGSTPKSSEPENFGDYLPFVKPGDFNRDGSITYDNEGLSDIGARKSRRVQANSALMVCIGATIGKAGFSEREIATNQQVNSWTPTTDTSAKFIYYQMTSSDFQLRVRHGAGQATLPIINKSKWSALTVVIPPTLDEQLKIVADLDALLTESMNLEAMYECKLTSLDELKKSLLHQAFTGSLTAKSTDKQYAELA